MTPAIAIFAFNRPESLRRLLDSLSACPEFAGADVTIFIDGPRNEAEAALVAKTRQVAETAVPASLRIVASPENKGLKRSIYQGVSDVCGRSGHAIVLEDDLVVSPAALTYFIEGLRRYADEPRVWSICGYMFESSRAVSPSCFFLPYAHPWGWATWHRAWSKFDIEADAISDAILNSKSFRTSLDVYGFYPMTNMLRLAQINLIDSWYIRWHRHVVLLGGVCLFPPTSYVENIGLKTGGTHVGMLNPHKFLSPMTKKLSSHVELMPKKVEIDFLALDVLKHSREVILHRAISHLGGFKRRLKAALGRWRSKEEGTEFKR